MLKKIMALMLVVFFLAGTVMAMAADMPTTATTSSSKATTASSSTGQKGFFQATYDWMNGESTSTKGVSATNPTNASRNTEKSRDRKSII